MLGKEYLLDDCYDEGLETDNLDYKMLRQRSYRILLGDRCNINKYNTGRFRRPLSQDYNHAGNS